MPRLLGHERSNLSRRTSLWLHLPLSRSRKFCELVGRPDRAAHQLGTALWGAALQHVLCAASAKCALERAHHSVVRVRRQIVIAAFAVGSQREHVTTLSSP